MSVRGVASLATWLMLGAATLAADVSSDSTASDSREYVLFSPTRPLLIRLHFRVDGDPLDAKWQAALDDLFASLDTDHDGGLSRQEVANAPSAQFLSPRGIAQGEPPDRLFIQMDRSADGQITRDEFRRYYRESAGPVMLSDRTARTPLPSVDLDKNISAEVLNEALIRALDRNGDGQLSRDELSAAPTELTKLDRDGDEVLTASELAPNAEGASGSTDKSAAPLRELRASDNPADLALDILARYGPPGARPAGKLNRQESKLDTSLFNELDANHDGTLTTAEAVTFSRREPDVDLLIEVGDSQRISAKQAPAAEDKPSPSHSFHFASGLTGVDVRFHETGGEVLKFDNAKYFKEQFAAADTDNNGYLDAKEARQNMAFRNVFKQMDADSDGMLFEKEVVAYVKSIHALQATMAGVHVGISFFDGARGLFDELDTNHDGRLGLRELREAQRLLDRLDANHDGQLSLDEIPRVYTLRIHRGYTLDDPSASSSLLRADEAASSSPTGPLWFLRMDRNHDGDVSRAEFWGTEEQFAAIDTDGDGLISRDEAERADARYRQ